MTIQPQTKKLYCVACGHRMVVNREPGTSWRAGVDSGVVCESCSLQEQHEDAKLVVRYCHKCGCDIPQSPIIECRKCLQGGIDGKRRSK